jgi:hypothetical protein
MTLFDYYFKSFVFTQDISFLITVIVGIKLLKHFDFSLKIFFALICIALISNIFLFTYAWILKKQNLFIINIYSLLEFALLSLFYITIINSLFFRRLIFLLLLIYILTSLFYFYTNSLSSMAYYKIAALETFLISCYALSFFIHSMNYNPKKNSTELPFFWINSGILIYYMPFILIFLFFEYLNKTSSEFLIGLINNSTNILTLVFITLIIIGFLKSKSQNPNINLKS